MSKYVAYLIDVEILGSQAPHDTFPNATPEAAREATLDELRRHIDFDHHPFLDELRREIERWRYGGALNKFTASVDKFAFSITPTLVTLADLDEHGVCSETAAEYYRRA